jgi:uncharacterized protein (TIGR00304 family)
MWIPVGVFLAGVACITVATVSGEAQVQLFIIFPVISGNSLLFILGILLIFASFILGFILAAASMTEAEPIPPQNSASGATAQTGEAPQKKTRFGGVVLIGPVPIIFGSDRKMALIMILLAIVLMAIVLALALVNL